MEFLKIAIPIVTFFLGALFTLFMSRRERRRETVRGIAIDLSDLINDWNAQLHRVNMNLDQQLEQREIERQPYLHLNNRMILPKLIRNLEALRRFRETQALRYHAESFLCMVSYGSQRQPARPKGLRSGYMMKDFARDLGAVRPLAMCSPCWEPDIAYEKTKWYFEERNPSITVTVCRAGNAKKLVESLAKQNASEGGTSKGSADDHRFSNSHNLSLARSSDPDSDATVVLDLSVLEIGRGNAYDVFLLVVDKVTQDVNKEAARFF